MVTDMNKKLIVIVFLLWSSAYCAFGQANQWGPFDPGALRNDGSNASSAATVRNNLGLGTMAVATSTDYIATDTFTGHANATGSAVHGLGTISTKADTDYVATSALALRLDTTNASISKNLDVAGNVGAATLGVTGHSTLTTASATRITAGSATATDTTRTTNYGFTQLGELGTGIKMRVLTGTISASAGNLTNFAHGSSLAKIVSVSAVTANGATPGISADIGTGGSSLAGYEYGLFITDSNVVIVTHTTNAESVLGVGVTIVVWYVE
jgi:hypothetical protein